MRRAYKQTDVGSIPDDWETATLGTVVEASAPIRYGVVQIGTDTADGVPIVPIKYIKEIGRAPLHRAAKSLEQRYARSRVIEGDVLISVKGTIGHVGIAPRGFSGNIAREIARIRIKSGVSREFIAHQLEAGSTQERIFRSVVGTTRQEFSIATVRRFEIALPNEAEQRAIAGALSDVDALLGALDRLITKKRDLKQAAMQQLLTGQTRLPGFSGEWEVKRLGELIETIADGGTPSTARPGNFGGAINWVVIDDIRDEITTTATTLTHDGLRACAARLWNPGTLIISTGATIGEVGIARIPVATKQGICGIAVNHDRVDVIFLKYWFMNNKTSLLSKAQGSTIKEVRAPTLIRFEISAPPVSEQTAIATILTDMDAELEALEQRRAKTAALKQGMMQELLTGRTRLV